MTTDSAPAPARWQLVAAAVRSWLAAAADKLDGFDIACMVSLSMMLAGLTIWVGIGPALTVVGAITFALVVYPEWLAHKARYAEQVRRNMRGS